MAKYAKSETLLMEEDKLIKSNTYQFGRVLSISWTLGTCPLEAC